MDANNNTNRSDYSNNSDQVNMPSLVAIAAFVILVNSVVIFLFCRSETLRRNTSNYLLLSLAISDLMTGAVNIPIFLGCIRTRGKLICSLVNTFHQFTAISTCYHILVITMDKYYAICRPLKKRVAYLKPVYCKVLCAVWIGSAIIAFAGYAVEKIKGPNLIYGSFSLVAILAIPYTVMVWAYVVMFRKIRQNRKNVSRHRNRASSQAKCLAVFASMAILYAACWTPWYITIFLYRLKIAHLHLLFEPLTYIRYATSLINPILYTWLKADFLAECKLIFLTSARKKPSNSLSTYMRNKHLFSSIRQKNEDLADNGNEVACIGDNNSILSTTA